MMPKWVLYGLGAILDFVLAVVAYVNERIVIAGILTVAGLLFVAAAIGAARQTNDQNKPK